jgi:hypothetical protein
MNTVLKRSAQHDVVRSLKEQEAKNVEGARSERMLIILLQQNQRWRESVDFRDLLSY